MCAVIVHGDVYSFSYVKIFCLKIATMHITYPVTRIFVKNGVYNLHYLAAEIV